MYIIISIVILIISYNLFKKAAGSISLTKLNMISWIFIYNIILQSFLAAVLVVNNWDNHYLISKITNENTRFYGWLAVMYTCVMLPLGMLLVNFITGRKTKILLNTYAGKSIESLISERDSYMKIPLCCLSIISILSVIYTFLSLSNIPLIEMIKGASAYKLALLRASASRDFHGNELIRNIFAIGLTPILTFVYYAYYKMTKSKKDYYMFIVMFFFTFLILTYNLAKSSFISFLLGFIFLKVLLDGQISRKFIYFTGVGILGLIIIMYIYIANQADIIELLTHYNSGITGRIMLSQSAGTYLMFDIFPNVYDFIGVKSISSYISILFDIENSDRAARIVMGYVKHGDLEAAGVVNSLFIGEAWANFGIVGVLIAPIWVGAMIQTLFITLLSMKKTPLFLALLVFFSYKSSVTGGFNDYIYNLGYLIIVMLIVVVYFTGFVLKKIKNNENYISHTK